MTEENSGALARIEMIIERLAKAQERDHKDMMSFARESNERITRIELGLRSTANSIDRLIELRTEDMERLDTERKRLDTLWENTDKRIGDLVLKIGEMISGGLK